MFLLRHYCSTNDIVGVVGADVPASSIYNILTTEFSPRKARNTKYVQLELFISKLLNIVNISIFLVFKYTV